LDYFTFISDGGGGGDTADFSEKSGDIYQTQLDLATSPSSVNLVGRETNVFGIWLHTLLDVVLKKDASVVDFCFNQHDRYSLSQRTVTS